MISVVQNKDIYEIRFPYDTVLLGYVKAVPGRRWNPKEKFWSIPKENLGFYINQIKGTVFESQLKLMSDEDININKPIESTRRCEIPDIDISDIKTYVQDDGRLFSHQEDCLRFAIGRKDKGNFSGFILSDQQGLGKTLEVINMALFKKQYEDAKHCLIINCLNSAKYNWVDDIQKHTNGEYEGYLLGSRVKRDGSIKVDGSGKDKYEDLDTGYKYGDSKYGELPFFLVTNIEALRTTDRSIKDKKERNIITTKIIEMIQSGEISMIAVDEIHRNASATSEQGKQLLRIKKETGKKVEWIPMTGTPIVNKPTDAFLPLILVDGHNFQSYFKWCQNFCVYGGYGGHQIIGYRNIPELKYLLESNMLRRTKEDTLDLPPKMYHIEYVENTDIQQRLYKYIREDMKNNPDTIIKSLNPMEEFLKLRQVNGCPELIDESIDPTNDNYIKVNAKISRLLQLVEDITQNNEKVVIFSNWVQPLRTVYRILTKHGYKVNSYTGTMDSEKREQHKQQFISDPSVQILLGTIGALGVSHTLTVANNVIFFDEPWNAATKEQAEDRCHRAGTTGTVHIYSIITKDTVDEKVHDIIHRKRGTSQYIVDNKLDLKNHPEQLKVLLDIK